MKINKNYILKDSLLYTQSNINAILTYNIYQVWWKMVKNDAKDGVKWRALLWGAKG